LLKATIRLLLSALSWHYKQNIFRCTISNRIAFVQQFCMLESRQDTSHDVYNYTAVYKLFLLMYVKLWLFHKTQTFHANSKHLHKHTPGSEALQDVANEHLQSTLKLSKLLQYMLINS